MTIGIKKCPFCKDGALERKISQQIYSYKNHSIEIEQPGEWCNICGEGILNGADLKATEKPIRDFQAQTDGLLTSADIQRIREKLKLTHAEAAAFFGGDPNMFAQYENGEATPLRAISHLLRLLDKHPDQLQELIES